MVEFRFGLVSNAVDRVLNQNLFTLQSMFISWQPKAKTNFIRFWTIQGILKSYKERSSSKLDL